jgi:membrane protease YdiL (CAAX protease family)
MLPNLLIFAEVILILCGLSYWILCLFGTKETPIWKIPNKLTRWEIPLSDFFLFFFTVLVSIIIGSQLVNYGVQKWVPGAKDGLLQETVIIGYATHIFAILGWITFSLLRPSIRLPKTLSIWPAFKRGFFSLVIVLPPLLIVALFWEFLLKNLGLSTDPQELIEILRSGDNLPYLIALIFLAIVVAPISEELFFRGGIFRFFYQKVPSWVAILVSSILFASAHGNWLSFLPLVLLGSLLCLLTQKSGSVKPSIFLHALFNLHSIILIFSGIDI